MKHIICLCLSALLMLSLAGCAIQSTDSTPTVEESAIQESLPIEAAQAVPSQLVVPDPVDVSIMGMTGPTTMGMVYMMNENDNGNLTDNNYTFTMAATIDEVTPQIVSGAVSIAAVPANVASVLYNNTDGGIQVLAINTLGVLYIVGSGDTVQSIDDLAGQTIYASGKGGTVEYALNYILAANDLTDAVTVEWKSEQAEVVAALAASENAIALLPQPFVTTAQMSNDSIRIALDMTQEWNATDSEGMLITGVLVGNTAFVEENPDVVDTFLAHYETSIQFVNDNVDESAVLVGQYGIVPEAVAQIALPYCGIAYIDGSEMETALTGYYAELYAQNTASIGGAMPGADFFYGT